MSLFTSESVTEGHPDKVCDQISDAVLDAVLEQDPYGRVACETCCTTGLVAVMGEISTTATIDIPAIVRKTVCDIGYDRPETGFDGNTCAVMVSVGKQSPDIALGTNEEVGGAGDQGIMFGYASRDTEDYMPLPITIANKLAYRLSEVRKDSSIFGLLPDGKTQVTVEYDRFGRASRIDTVVVSTQHLPSVKQDELRYAIKKQVVTPVLEETKMWCQSLDINSYRLLVNPTGRFIKGGPAADTGLTGRKIIVDTYGGKGAHGGGAFSGKDATKVDRSAAYAARHIAKNIVAARLADHCLIQLAYAIGVPQPVSVNVNTYATGRTANWVLEDIVCSLYDLTPKGIINRFGLRHPIYEGTAAYGHFGTVRGQVRPWEELDMVDAILSKAKIR